MDIKDILPPQYQAVAPKEKSKSAKVYVILAVLVLIFIAAGLWLLKKNGSKDNDNSATPPVTRYGENILDQASRGNLIAGFDRSFVADPQADIISSSEATSPKSGFKMLVTFYESSLSVEKLAAEYDNFFDKNGWKLVANSSQKDQADLFANKTATGETLQVNVVSVPPQQKTLVKVEFLKKINP